VEDDEAIGSLDPSYSLYKTLADIRGVRWVSLGDPCAKFSPSKTGRVSLALITNPNNPTGTLIPPCEIAAFAKRFRGVVVVDEAYVEYASADCMKLATAPRNRNLIVMRTFSKAYSLAGLRVGYCVGPKDLIDALFKIKVSYNVDAIAQTLALAAFKDQKTLRATVRKVIATRMWFVAELEKRGWDVLKPEANFIFARPPVERDAKGRGNGFLTACEKAPHLFTALRERNIFNRYFKGPKTGDRVRISIGTDAQMKRVLREIDDILA
jgi:histidinol-phosphate aminotransferase